MTYKIFRFFKATILTALCVLSLGGIASGIALSVMKSPSDQAQIYVALFEDYKAQPNLNAAESMARIALSYQPYNMTLWKNLESIEQQKQSTTSVVTTHRYKSFAALNPKPITP